MLAVSLTDSYFEQQTRVAMLDFALLCPAPAYLTTFWR